MLRHKYEDDMASIFLIAFLLLFPSHVSSQELQVQTFKQVGTVGGKSNIKDMNGNPCALIIISPFQNGFEFENTFISKVEAKDTAYWVYMAQGAKRLRIKKTGYLPKDIVFADYGINTLSSACCYELRIVDMFASSNFEIVDRQSIDDIYSQKWNYKGEKLSPVVKMIINREALGGKKEAQIAMANICIFEKEYKLALKWVDQIIEEGDSMCLKEMNGELLYHYALNIPHPEMYEEYDGREDGRDASLAFIIGQTLLKEDYDRASKYCLIAYKKGYDDAFMKSSEFKNLSNDISPDYLFSLMEKSFLLKSVIMNTSHYFGFYLSPIIYIVSRKLAEYGCDPARKLVAEFNELLGVDN